MRLSTLLLAVAATAACSSNAAPSSSNETGPSSPPPMASLDGTHAGVTANVLLEAFYFLEGRDVEPGWAPRYLSNSMRSVNTSGMCMLSGTYTVTGTERVSDTTNPQIQRNYTWVFTQCRHSASDGDVTIDGTVQQVETLVETYPSQQLLSDNATFTSSSVTATGTLSADSFSLGSLVSSCAYQANVVDMQSGNTDSGTLCAVQF